MEPTIEIRLSGAHSDKLGHMTYWGNVSDGFRMRSTPRFKQAKSALIAARTIALNMNGDASGGGLYQGRAKIIEIFHRSFPSQAD